MKNLYLIAAYTKEWHVIGDNGKIPWHYPEDFRFFKQMTKGHPVIMGRKTWDSLPKKPLPGRTNVIVSRSDAALKSASRSGIDEHEGVRIYSDLMDAIEHTQAYEGAIPFIIGGSQIYEQALPLVTRMYITEIQNTHAGDTFFPYFDYKEWEVTERQMSADGQLEFTTYDRI